MEGSVRYAVTKHAEHEPSHFNRVTHIFPLYSLLCHYEFSDCLNNCLLHHPCSFGDLGSPFSLWSLAVLDALSKWYCAVLVILSLSDLLYLVTVLKASPCCGTFPGCVVAVSFLSSNIVSWMYVHHILLIHCCRLCALRFWQLYTTLWLCCPCMFLCPHCHYFGTIRRCGPAAFFHVIAVLLILAERRFHKAATALVSLKLCLSLLLSIFKKYLK